MYRDSNLVIHTTNNHVIINTDNLAYTGVNFNAYPGKVSLFGIYAHWNHGEVFDVVISTSPTLLDEGTIVTHHVDGHPAKIIFIHWDTACTYYVWARYPNGADTNIDVIEISFASDSR